MAPYNALTDCFAGSKRDRRSSLRTRIPPEYGIFASCLRYGEAVAQGARLADQSTGITNRTNHASFGIFQQ